MLDVETKRGYWLTVFAQDHGVVPLSSSLQVCHDECVPSRRRTSLDRRQFISLFCIPGESRGPHVGTRP